LYDRALGGAGPSGGEVHLFGWLIDKLGREPRPGDVVDLPPTDVLEEQLGEVSRESLSLARGVVPDSITNQNRAALRQKLEQQRQALKKGDLLSPATPGQSPRLSFGVGLASPGAPQSAAPVHHRAAAGNVCNKANQRQKLSKLKQVRAELVKSFDDIVGDVDKVRKELKTTEKTVDSVAVLATGMMSVGKAIHGFNSALKHSDEAFELFAKGLAVGEAENAAKAGAAELKRLAPADDDQDETSTGELLFASIGEAFSKYKSPSYWANAAEILIREGVSADSWRRAQITPDEIHGAVTAGVAAARVAALTRLDAAIAKLETGLK